MFFFQEYLLGAFWFSQSLVVSTMYKQDVRENYLVCLVYKCVKQQQKCMCIPRLLGYLGVDCGH